MACLRNEEDRLANCLRRLEVRQTQKARDLAVAVLRNFNAQRKPKYDILSLYSINKLLRNY